MKKVILLLLVCALLIPLMASCGKKPTTPPAENVTTKKQEKESPVEVRDLDREVTILEQANYNYLEVEAVDSDIMKEAYQKRLNYLEDNYGVTFKNIDAINEFQTLVNEISGGGTTYDIINPHPQLYIGSLMTTGVLNNICGFDNIDLTQPWWNQSFVENYTVNNFLPFIVGDSAVNTAGFMAFVMNNAMYQRYGYKDNLYELVDQRKWTLEKFGELAKETGLDALEESDREYGLILHQGLVHCFFFGSGEQVLKKNNEGVPVFKFNADKCQSLAEWLYEVVYGDYTGLCTYSNATFATSKQWTTFASGKALMIGFDFVAFGSMLKSIESFDMVYLPNPLFDEDQKEYHTLCGSGFVGIPTTAQNPEDIALLLSAINWHSHENLRNTYVNTFMSFRVADDINQRNVLLLIIDSVMYDLGFSLDTGKTSGLALGMLERVVVEGKSYSVANYISANEEQIAENFRLQIQNLF